MERFEAGSPAWEAHVRTRRREVAPPEVRATVAEIIAAVRARGDEALCELTRRFDGCTLTPAHLRVTQEELAAVPNDPTLEAAVRTAITHVRAFHERQRRREWQWSDAPGGAVGEIVRPVSRAGVYVPGGTAPLLSTVIMTVVPAQVAGVEQICVVTPPGPDGHVNSGILAACRACGVEEIYRVGGAQAIAALAFGTATIPAVEVIAGPGNRYVTEAKRQVFGYVGVDLLAGPSESMIVMDDTAEPALVAIDLLSQAEHHDSTTYLVGLSGLAIDRVETHLYALVENRLRSASLRQAVQQRLFAVHVRSLEHAAEVVNAIAPEHLQIITRDNETILQHVRNAGAIFLGPWAPVPLGDFVAGPSHVLPTGGAARFASGLGTDTFLKRIAIMACTAAQFAPLAPVIATFGDAEQLPAHALTATMRTPLLPG
ncbi:MAG: histidinol dehydrogenase [bacterium]|nr:histidinol dehydrogenase [bacterium]